MPILKANEPLPKRPVVILIYGEPGIGKTSLFNTSTNPLLIDFDRGKDRAIFRQDTLVVNTWEDIEAEEKAGTFKSYATVGIDTAKAALDDFLMSYVTKKDFKNAKNKLANRLLAKRKNLLIFCATIEDATKSSHLITGSVVLTGKTDTATRERVKNLQLFRKKSCRQKN